LSTPGFGGKFAATRLRARPALLRLLPLRHGGAMARSPWASLPAEVLLRIAASLPADSCLALAAMCSGWRDALRGARSWTRLDLSEASGVAVPVTEALLRCASRRARGTLVALDVSGRGALTALALDAVLWANAGALASVRAHGHTWHSVVDVTRMLRLGGATLASLSVDVCVSLTDLQEVIALRAMLASGRLVLHGVRLRGDADMPPLSLNTALRLLRLLAGVPGARLHFEELQLDTAPPARRAVRGARGAGAVRVQRQRRL
jgi:hypothetical protein